MTARLQVIGLCGGIGAGKSTVARLLAERGATVIDVDDIGRDVLTQDNVRDAVVAEFGDGVLDDDGHVDRGTLATLVFGDRTPGGKSRLSDLEAISHPAINKELARRLDALTGEMRTSQNPRQATDKHHLVVLDMAVLVESDLGRLPDGRGYTEVVVVEAGRETRLERLGGRGMTVGDARARMASQASSPEKMPPQALMAMSGPTSDLISSTILTMSGKMARPLRPPVPIDRAESLVGLELATVNASTPCSTHAWARDRTRSLSSPLLASDSGYGGNFTISGFFRSSPTRWTSSESASGSWNTRNPTVLGELMFTSTASTKGSRRRWHLSTSSTIVPAIETTIGVSKVARSVASSRRAAASSPCPGKPSAFMSESSSG